MYKRFRIISIVAFFVLVATTAFRRSETSVEINKESLGEKLFFDSALSLDYSISCASCHIPQFAFADTVAFSKGVGGKFGQRNTPSVMNVKFRDRFFYDGRAKDIIDQVHFPIQDPNEMNLSMDSLVQRLSANPSYVKWFNAIYNEGPTKQNIADAIAAYEMTLETSNTPFDAFMNDVPNSLTESEQRGREVFLSDKAKCFDCHFGPDFTGDEFKNIGLYDGLKWNDNGLYGITKDSADLGKFKVPGLRNVGVTGPYMHNGAFKTLKEVIDFYDNPFATVTYPINIDETLKKPLGLTKQEKEDLLNFLLTLTDKKFKNRTN